MDKKKALYEFIMRDVAKVVKKRLNEAENQVAVDYGQFEKLIEAIKKHDISIMISGNLFLSDSKNVGYKICFKPTEKTVIKNSVIKNITVNFIELCDTDKYGRSLNSYNYKDDKSIFNDIVFSVSKNTVACVAWDEKHDERSPEVLFTNAAAVSLAGPDRSKVDITNFKLFKN